MVISFASSEAKKRIESVLEKYDLPTKSDFTASELISFIKRDKKAKGDKITVIYVEEIGSFIMKDIEINEIEKYIDGGIL